ncbi:hypothetical protein L5515_009030 [Caenorhabditis briggsae]|uniref:T20D4.11-like domain-containing protein n=1 Tax=Caenorhabditis briggsae TaxID=6238 RepID=A0AAE9F8R7_CAEBR|nr:hypothetical protein L5515_009030 [Caenorhabditis briggsae]
MCVLLHLLLVLSIIQCSEAGNKSQGVLHQCRDEEKLSISLCAPIIEVINQYPKLYTDRIHDPMYYQNLEKLCQEAKGCVSDLNCSEADALRNDIDKVCSYSLFFYAENQKCLQKFHQKAYVANKTEDSSCYAKFPSFQNEMDKTYKTLMEGEECFMNHIEENCNDTSRKFFVKSYNYLVEYMTNKPEIRTCDPYHMFLEQECMGIFAELIDVATSGLSPLELVYNWFMNGRFWSITDVCKDARDCFRQNECSGLFSDTSLRVEKVCNAMKKHRLLPSLLDSIFKHFSEKITKN